MLLSAKKPVRVEFSLFQVARGEVPGVDDLAAQIDACYKYKKDSPKEEPTLRELKKSISRDTITCLRVSDFNTSGIFGVKVNKSGVPFYDLTKGSGVSNKGGSSGGFKRHLANLHHLLSVQQILSFILQKPMMEHLASSVSANCVLPRSQREMRTC